MEIIEENDTNEFLEDEEMGAPIHGRIRNWAFIPKRLITDVNIKTILAGKKQLRVAKIGKK